MIIVTCDQCRAQNRVNLQTARAMIPTCGNCGARLELGTDDATPRDNAEPLDVADATFDRVLTDAGDRPLLVDCWAPWCGPCRMVGPIMEQLAAEAKGRYVIAKLNVDHNPRTAAKFQISSIPTMLIFKRGRLVDRLIGAQPKSAIAAKLQQAA